MAFDAQEPRGFLSRHRYPLLGVLVVAIGGYGYYKSTRPVPVGVVEARQGPAERVLAITGRTLGADMVPAYLQRLGREKSFSGRQFASLDIRQPKSVRNAEKGEAPGDPKFLEFSLSTAERAVPEPAK